jgi:drug/metabolite transporter (DMT)-like permease
VVSGYCAINLLSVGDAIVVGFLSPVFTGIAGQVFLGERWDTTDRIAGACSLVGITLIARPVFIFGNIFGDLKPDVDGSIISPRLPELGRVIPSIDGYPDSEPQNYSQAVWNQTIASSSVLYKRTVNISETRILGALAGVVSAIFVAGSMIAIRKASSKAHALHIITAFHVTAIPLVLVSNALLPKFVEPLPWVFPEKVLTWTFLFMATFGGLGGQLCIGLALQREKAGKAMAISYIQAVFAFLAEFLVWGVIPHWLSIIGGLIVIFCVSMVALLKKAA